MVWKYHQEDGTLYHGEAYVGVGYAGTGPGRNNTMLEGEKAVGPIPRGAWKVGKSYKHKSLGPIVMNLDPVGHNALGRSLFRIHGDNTKGDASNGCIIMSRPIRKMIAESKDDELLVL